MRKCVIVVGFSSNLLKPSKKTLKKTVVDWTFQVLIFFFIYIHDVIGSHDISCLVGKRNNFAIDLLGGINVILI